MNDRILIFGAGAIGSIFAGKLRKANCDITILARGKRYEEIQSRGVVLQNAMNGEMETIDVGCIRTLDPEDLYDFIIVVVQNMQIDDILPALSQNRSQNIVFVVNNPMGYSKYISAVGRERVMIGFPSAGGERKDGVVTYYIGKGIAKIMQTTTFGELTGEKTERLTRLVKMFKNAGFEPTISTDMDAWQKTHIAFVVPVGNALYQFNSNNYELAKSRPVISDMIHATREGFKALRDNGIKIEPRKLNFYYLPVWLLCTIFQILFSTKIAEYAMAKHTIVAAEEMKILEEQFLSMFDTDDLHYWKKLHLTAPSS